MTFMSMAAGSDPVARLGARAQVAGLLLLVTAVTHLSQLWALDVTAAVKVSAAFCLPYAALGGALLARPSRLAGWSAIITTAIGGISGIVRFFAVNKNVFSIVHPLIDIVIITLLASWLLQAARQRPEPFSARSR